MRTLLFLLAFVISGCLGSGGGKNAASAVDKFSYDWAGKYAATNAVASGPCATPPNFTDTAFQIAGSSSIEFLFASDAVTWGKEFVNSDGNYECDVTFEGWPTPIKFVTTSRLPGLSDPFEPPQQATEDHVVVTIQPGCYVEYTRSL